MGVALLAAETEKRYVVYFVGGEVLLYLIYKVVRSDYFYWTRVEGGLAIVLSLIERTLVKLIADFSECLHLRHPYELGGLAYSLSVICAQVFPFVALQLYEGGDDIKDSMGLFLVCSLVVWILLNAAFFSSINLENLDTFFGIKPAPQYTCEWYSSADEDRVRFEAIFSNRIQYTTSIHAEVKEWIAENIDRWKAEKLAWFKIRRIPNNLLSMAVLEAEGGGARRRRNLRETLKFGFDDSLRESLRLDSKRGAYRVHPE